MGDEHWWVGTSSPTPDVAPVVEPPTQRNWSPSPQQRSTVSWPSPRQERIQRQSQASEQIILPEPPTEGPPPVRRTEVFTLPHIFRASPRGLARTPC